MSRRGSLIVRRGVIHYKCAPYDAIRVGNANPMQPAGAIGCPSCEGVLYRSPPARAKWKGWFPLDGGLVVESFRNGDFVFCPHCFERVAVVPARSPAGLGFKIA